MIIRDRSRRRMAALGARLGFLVSVMAFLSSLLAMVAGSPAVSAAPTQGTLALISPTHDATGAEIAGGGAPITKGDSETDFSFRLPAGAACSGDSANDNYRVYGYMVGAPIDPATLTFIGSEGVTPQKVGAPIAEFRAPLYDTFGSPYLAQTAAADTPPGPGNVVNIPTFDLKAVANSGEVPAGAYNIGIACVDADVLPTPLLDRLWNVVLDIETNPADTGPIGISWTARPAAAVTTVELEADPATDALPGETITLTATVTPDDAEGTVTFKNGKKSLEDPVEVNDGIAELELDDLDVGKYSFVAVFNPKSGTPFEQATSDELDFSVSETAAEETTTTTTTGDSTTTTTTTTSVESTDTTSPPTDFGATAVDSTGGPSTGTPPLAFSGSSLSLAVWAVLLLVFGRMAVLLGRRPAVRPAVIA